MGGLGGKENDNSNNFMKHQTTFLRDDFSSDEELNEKMTISINPRQKFKIPKVTNNTQKPLKKPGEKVILEIKPYGVE